MISQFRSEEHVGIFKSDKEVNDLVEVLATKGTKLSDPMVGTKNRAKRGAHTGPTFTRQ